MKGLKRLKGLKAIKEIKEVKEVKELKIDLGCGKSKQAGYVGVDKIAFDGVDIIVDLAKEKWPWEDGSVDQVYSSHFVEHLEANERAHFVNELYRVLKMKAQANIIVPHWASCRAYGDLTHKWPPVSEFWFYYLSKMWREQNAPHNNELYNCDFEVTWGYGMVPELAGRNEEYKAYAMKNYKEAVTDIIATFVKK